MHTKTICESENNYSYIHLCLHLKVQWSLMLSVHIYCTSKLQQKATDFTLPWKCAKSVILYSVFCAYPQEFVKLYNCKETDFSSIYLSSKTILQLLHMNWSVERNRNWSRPVIPNGVLSPPWGHLGNSRGWWVLRGDRGHFEKSEIFNFNWFFTTFQKLTSSSQS